MPHAGAGSRPKTSADNQRDMQGGAGLSAANEEIACGAAGVKFA